MQLNKKYRYILSIMTGIMLSAAFPYIGSVPPIAFFALVPLLIVEEHIFSKRLRARKFFWHVYLTFVIYNALTCWWVVYASAGGVVMAVFANSFLMLLPWVLFHWTKKYVGVKEGYISLPFFWLAFEYFHYHWELSWPWLTFGNIFSIVPSWVQWYEYSGVLGGSLWILMANLLIFQILKNVWGRKQAWQKQRMLIVFLGVLIFIPILLSIFIAQTKTLGDKRKMNVVVVQPNIDPYKEKFSSSPKEQILKIRRLAEREITPTTDFIVAPETAIPTSVDEWQLKRHPAIEDIDSTLKLCQPAAWVIGASTHAIFDEKVSDAARPTNNGRFYESYNTAILLQKEKKITTYHKSKLVLGVEYLPFAWLLKPIESWAIDLGGTSGSLAKEKEPKVFTHNDFNVIPSICYESVYGGYLASFSEKAEIDALFVITNDGWWKDTPGYKQHFSFSCLRAIEMRKPVVRSANTGWSGIIDPFGNVLVKTKWWEPDAFAYEVETNREKTFYMVYGNIIGRTSGFVAALVLLLILVKYLRRFGTRTPFGGKQDNK